MKKVLLLILAGTIVMIIHACCKDQKFKSTLSTLDYVGIQDNITDTVYANVSNRLLISFRIINEFNEISLGSVIPTCKADGGICTEQTYYEKYDDPIETIFISCDKDLLRVNAHQNLTSTIWGYYLFPESPQNRTPWPLILEELNESPYHHSGGTIIWLEIEGSDIISTGFHKFTMRLETASGRVLEATSKNIYWIK
jgi:hypothetical protein